MPQPTELRLTADGSLRIMWDDGRARLYPVRELREHCPCASCRERRSAPPPPATELVVLGPGETQPLRIAAMQPMGRYAYAIHFSDGHDAGIFTLELLQSLGAPTDE